MTRVAEAASKVAVASATEAEANDNLSRHNGWALAVDAIIERPDGVDIVESRIEIDRDAPVANDARVVAALRDRPPGWALNVLFARLDLADREREPIAYQRSVVDTA